MVSFTHVPGAMAENQAPTDVEAFMLFLADSMTDEGQLITPLDLEQDSDEEDYPDDTDSPDSDAGTEGVK